MVTRVHRPVLLHESIHLLSPQPAELVVDGTLGRGGHAAELLRHISPGGILLGLDLDPTRIEETQILLRKVALDEHLKVSVRLVHRNYADLPEELEHRRANVVLLDLGFASDQLESGRGFSFQEEDAPLQMTYDPDAEPASKLLDELDEEEIVGLLTSYGEERYAARIAHAIVKARPITTSSKLAEIVRGAVSKSYERGRLNPATRTFQALRIYVNHELENLQQFLDSLDQIMAPGGRLGIISFHSLEDRIVKNVFRDLVKEGKAELLTKKAVTATAEEIVENPRARSAKLRAIRYVSNQ